MYILRCCEKKGQNPISQMLDSFELPTEILTSMGILTPGDPVGWYQQFLKYMEETESPCFLQEIIETH